MSEHRLKKAEKQGYVYVGLRSASNTFHVEPFSKIREIAAADHGNWVINRPKLPNRVIDPHGLAVKNEPAARMLLPEIENFTPNEEKADKVRLGVEYETTVPLPDRYRVNSATWLVGSDCSVRQLPVNRRMPGVRYACVEYRMTRGRPLDDTIEAVNGLPRSVVPNRTCGLHIHTSSARASRPYEICGWTPHAVERLICLWNIYGPFITQTAPLYRRHRSYSRPVWGALIWRNEEVFPNDTLAIAQRYIRANTRYLDLNIQALAAHSSIEFRVWEATSNWDFVRDTIRLVHALTWMANDPPCDVFRMARLLSTYYYTNEKELTNNIQQISPLPSDKRTIICAAMSKYGFDFNQYVERYSHTGWNTFMLRLPYAVQRLYRERTSMVRSSDTWMDKTRVLSILMGAQALEGGWAHLDIPIFVSRMNRLLPAGRATNDFLANVVGFRQPTPTTSPPMPNASVRVYKDALYRYSLSDVERKLAVLHRRVLEAQKARSVAHVPVWDPMGFTAIEVADPAELEG